MLHFRHDDKEKSAPIALLKSLAAMLCHTLEGFEAALEEQIEKVDAALVSADINDIFEALLTEPLARMTPPDRPQLIIIDALDEISKEGQKPLLTLIANQLSQLPSWLRLLVTSREEVCPTDGSECTHACSERHARLTVLSAGHQECAERLQAEGAACRREAQQG